MPELLPRKEQDGTIRLAVLVSENGEFAKIVASTGEVLAEFRSNAAMGMSAVAMVNAFMSALDRGEPGEGDAAERGTVQEPVKGLQGGGRPKVFPGVMVHGRLPGDSPFLSLSGGSAVMAGPGLRGLAPAVGPFGTARP